MKTMRLAMIGVFAALLATPPATAAEDAPKSEAASGAGKLLVQEGLADLNGQRFDAAIQRFSQATQSKHDSATYFLLGYAHYQRGFKSGNPETADKDDALETIQTYATALALDPDLKALVKPYRLYHSLALSYEAIKAYDKAINAYKMAFQNAPHNPMLPLYAARLRYRMGDVPKSTNNLALSLREARLIKKDRLVIDTIKSSPFFSVLLSAPENLAVVRNVERGRDPLDAGTLVAQAGNDLGDLRDAVSDRGPSMGKELSALPPQNPAVLEALSAGDEHFKYRQYRPAIDSFNDAVRLDAQSQTLSPVQLSFLYERMGASYNRLGQTKEALAALEKSLELNSQQPEIRAKVSALKEKK